MFKRFVVCTAFAGVLATSGVLRDLRNRRRRLPRHRPLLPHQVLEREAADVAPPPIKSPEVSDDRRVTFRLRAPSAKDVAVTLAGKSLPMQRDDQGVWSVTTDSLDPNYYTSSLVVDGTSVNDPANRQIQTSFGSFQSMFVVPGWSRGSRRRTFRAVPSHDTPSDRPWRTMTVTFSCTRRPGTILAAHHSIRSCTCFTAWAMTRNAG